MWITFWSFWCSNWVIIPKLKWSTCITNMFICFNVHIPITVFMWLCQQLEKRLNLGRASKLHLVNIKYSWSVDEKKENSAILQPTLGLTFVAALPTHCQWEESMRWSLECQDRSFECDISKLRKRAAQNSQPPTVRRICIGRLMCFPPHPCLCFHVTTAWQPGKCDTGREKKGSSLDFVFLRKELTHPTVWYPYPPVVAQWWRNSAES